MPIPDISNKRFPETRPHEDRGLHRILYRFSPDDYRRINEVWNGNHPEDGQPLTVQDGPPEGAPCPDLDEEPQLTAPDGPDGPDPAMLEEYAKRIFGKDVGKMAAKRGKR